MSKEVGETRKRSTSVGAALKSLLNRHAPETVASAPWQSDSSFSTVQIAEAIEAQTSGHPKLRAASLGSESPLQQTKSPIEENIGDTKRRFMRQDSRGRNFHSQFSKIPNPKSEIVTTKANDQGPHEVADHLVQEAVGAKA